MLWFLLIIPAVVLLLLLFPVSVEAVVFDGLTLTLRILFLRFKLLPAPPEKIEKARKTVFGKKYTSPFNAIKQQVKQEGLFNALSEIVDWFRIAAPKMKTLLSHTKVSPFVLKIAVAGEDAAKTAEAAGKLCAVVYPGVGLLSSAVKLKKPEVIILPRFDIAETRFYFKATARLSPVFLFSLVKPLFLFEQKFNSSPEKSAA